MCLYLLILTSFLRNVRYKHTIVCYKVHFLYLQVYCISCNSDFISQNCNFISLNSDCFQNYEFKSHNSDIISQNCEFM